MSAFQLRTTDGVVSLVCIPLLSFDVLVATSTRQRQEHAAYGAAFQGESAASGTDPMESRRAAAEFARFLSALGLAHRPLLTARQRHTNRCVVFEAPTKEPETPPIGDALLTCAREVVMGIHTADCAPIFLFDARTRARAAVHAGWRGTLGRIVERAVSTMVERFGTRAEDCYAAIGPTIGPCCYEVGPDVREPFRREFPDAEAFIGPPTPRGTAHLDLVEANVRQLLACAIPRTQIFVSGLCTACHPQLFFSHRRDSRTRGRVGRMLSIIGDLAP
jgi:YfiH family protein